MESKASGRSGAIRVAAGIFSSRLMGLLRDRAVAHYFGVGAFADAFSVAFRVPNVLQNLLGEGTISAAFIPIYTRMVDQGREREAGRFAGAIFGLLLCVTAVISLIGVLFAQEIVSVTVHGFVSDAAEVAAGTQAVDRFPLAVGAVRILFPMTGILVLSAWALGVLNSHRRFFLPYFAPVLWNAAIIGGLLMAAQGLFAGENAAFGERLFYAACYGALAGGVLQFLVQLPLVIRLTKGLRVSLSTRVEGVRPALRAVGPVIAGRGAYQISGLFDMFLASFLAVGAVSSVRMAIMLYVLPVSLFGMSVAAAELPELARGGGLDAAFRQRLVDSLRQIGFLIVPTVVGYLLFGFLVVGALFRTRGGEFGLPDNWIVYIVLGGYALGLVATTWSRLMQNAFYALADTKTPARIALVRVSVSAAAAVAMIFWLDGQTLAVLESASGQAPFRLGALGLSLAASLGAWVELLSLRKRLGARVEGFRLPVGNTFKLIGLALLAAAPAAGVWILLPDLHVALIAVVVLGIYASTYLGLAQWTGLSELNVWLRRRKRGE